MIDQQKLYYIWIYLQAEPLFWLGGQELGIKNNLNVMPLNYFLSQNFPNPFNPVTKINYSLAKGSNVNIVIYDILGNVVKEVYNGFQTPGKKSINWNATNFKGETVSSGIYFYELRSPSFTARKKMLLIR